MTRPAPVVFLLDVDNTLLDNDRVVADLKHHLAHAFGAECQKRYWTIFEERRTQLGYTDYLGALQRKCACNCRRFPPSELRIRRRICRKASSH